MQIVSLIPYQRTAFEQALGVYYKDKTGKKDMETGIKEQFLPTRETNVSPSQRRYNRAILEKEKQFKKAQRRAERRMGKNNFEEDYDEED
jgi:hypothetical protein